MVPTSPGWNFSSSLGMVENACQYFRAALAARSVLAFWSATPGAAHGRTRPSARHTILPIFETSNKHNKRRAVGVSPRRMPATLAPSSGGLRPLLAKKTPSIQRSDVPFRKKSRRRPRHRPSERRPGAIQHGRCVRIRLPRQRLFVGPQGRRAIGDSRNGDIPFHRIRLDHTAGRQGAASSGDTPRRPTARPPPAWNERAAPAGAAEWLRAADPPTPPAPAAAADRAQPLAWAAPSSGFVILRPVRRHESSPLSTKFAFGLTPGSCAPFHGAGRLAEDVGHIAITETLYIVQH